MNPMAMALKSRRAESAKPQMQEQISGPPGDGGADKLQMIVASLTPEDKAQLMEMLSAEQEQAPEAIDGESPSTQEDDAGQSKVSPDELAALKGEAANMFQGQGQALGEDEPEGQAPKGLGDRFKASISKHFKK